MYYIYRITNLINNKTYIGQHKYKNVNDHYMGSGKRIKQAIKKYGVNNFVKELLEIDIATRKEADEKEIYYICEERKKGKAEYNITDGGDGFRSNHTEETKQKIGKAFKGNTYGFKKGVSPWNKGKHYKMKDTSNMHHNPWNKGLNGYRKGVCKSIEQKLKMKETMRLYVLKYNIYKAQGGYLKWNEWRKTLQTTNQ